MSVVWTPLQQNLGTLKENQDFVYNISAVSQADDNGQPINLLISVEFVGDAPDDVVINQSTTSLSISGNTGYHFDDKLNVLTDDYTYQFFSTLSGEIGKSVWDKANHLTTRQVVGFYPDPNRYKEFNLIATARYLGQVVDTKNYKIVIFDPNWDGGKTQLKTFLEKIKNNDSNSN